ncbi:DNA polymerase III subunit gamma and tau [Frankia sp. AgB32]|uniref:DNA polymerase III subunit gamma and tau n=1 Tax=Frankia sp. AgB32 TaxID=631119 RepID=UPI00200DDDEC|nr:DNA polymerase III subunit gamma and tau [Frankia sp. AgB32]MCK9894780.1 DNA polymerase III subunit gamma and tau [Frankia sp. AgB32]
MSAALYNRYRPATFAQVVGQEHVTDALRKALSTGRLHHAYLFSGPRGCGKTSSARILAASLNCVNGPTPEPCGVCDECVGIRTGSSMDVTEIDAASHGLVDDARDLRERAFFAPASARFKVFVVDEAHMVTAAAFNALLKVVEEPPPYLKFVFATTEPDKVIATIRSRTHHYSFRLVPPAVLRDHLASVCVQEGVHVESTVLPLVVRAGAGSVRDSLSVLDQLIAGADDDGLSYERAVALLGMTDGVLLDETVDALTRHDGAALFTVVDKVVSAGHDPRRFATDLLDRFRDLIVLAAVPDAADRGLLESFSPDQIDRMRAQSASVGPAELSRTADLLHDGLVEMRGTTSPRLMLELILARALLPGASADPAALLTRLERLERRAVLDGPEPAAGHAVAAHAAAGHQPAAVRHAPTAATEGHRPAPAATPAGPGSPAPAPGHTPSTGRGAPAHAQAAGPGPVTPGPAAGGPPGWAPASTGPRGAGEPSFGGQPAGGGRIDAAGLRLLWDEVLALAARRSRKTHAILKDHAAVADVRGDEVILAFASVPMGRMFGQGNNGEVFCAALTERLGGSWRVSVAPAGGSPGTGRGGGRPAGGPTAPGGGQSSGGGFGGPGGGPGWGGQDQHFAAGAGQGAAGMAPTGAGQGSAGPGATAGPGPSAQATAGGYPGSSAAATDSRAGFGGAPESSRPAEPTAWSGGDDGGGGRPAPGHHPYPPAAGGTRPATAYPDTAYPDTGRPASAVQGGGSGGTMVAAEAAIRSPAVPGRAAIPGQVDGYGHPDDARRSEDQAHRPGPTSGVGAWSDAGRDGAGLAQQAGPQLANGHGAGWEVAGQRAQQQRDAGQVVAPSSDEPSLDDEDAPQQAGGARGGEEAAMSLLRTGLGATVIEQIPTT